MQTRKQAKRASSIKANQLEWERRAQRKFREFHATHTALMNNTKWREVLVCAAKLDLLYRAAYIGSELPADPQDDFALHSLTWVPVIAYRERYLDDWAGMCGPYKDLLWVMFPRRYYRVTWTSSRVYIDQPLDKFLDELKPMGQLPLQITDGFVRVDGYR